MFLDDVGDWFKDAGNGIVDAGKFIGNGVADGAGIVYDKGRTLINGGIEQVEKVANGAANFSDKLSDKAFKSVDNLVDKTASILDIFTPTNIAIVAGACTVAYIVVNYDKSKS